MDGEGGRRAAEHVLRDVRVTLLLAQNGRLVYRGCVHRLTGSNTHTSTAVIDLSTARPKWRLDGPGLSGHLLYSLVNPGYANSYHHRLVG